MLVLSIYAANQIHFPLTHNNQPNPQILKDLVKTQMPFGKYKGRFICDLPAYYLEWFASKGFPKGKIGVMLETMFVIKTEGLDFLLDPLKPKRRWH